MAAAEETLRQSAAITAAAIGPFCIVYPEPAEGKEKDFELKSSLLHRIPIFNGLPNEELNRYLARFQFIVESMGPEKADPQILKMKAFPFSLEAAALDWLDELLSGHIDSWDKLTGEFLAKFFPPTRVMRMRREITGIKQKPSENYAEYYARFQKLHTRNPQHGYSKANLLHFFYEGLHENERRLLDSASGGAFVDLTHDAAEKLIAKVASNAQQYSTRASTVNEVNSISDSRLSNIEDKLSKLTAFLIEGSAPRAQVCGICSTQGHSTDACPTIAEPGHESVNAMGYNNAGNFQQRNNPFSSTYNEGWRNHPNLKWSNNENTQNPAPNRPPGFFQKPQVPQNQNFNNNNASSSVLTTNPLYDEMFKMLTASANSIAQAQQEQGKEMADLKKQIGDILNHLNQNQGQGKLPAGTITNPNFEQAKVMTTRSGKVFGLAVPVQEEQEVVEILKSQVEKDPATSKAEILPKQAQTGETGNFDPSEPNILPSTVNLSLSQPPVPAENAAATSETAALKQSHPKNSKNKETGKNSNPSNSVLANHLSSMSFPSRFAQSKKEATDKEIHEKEQANGDSIEPTLEFGGEKAKFNISDKKPPPDPMEQVASVKEVVVANHELPDRFVVGQHGFTLVQAKGDSMPPRTVIGKSEWIDQMLEELKSAGYKRKTCHGDLPGHLVEYCPFFEAGIT